VVQREDRGLTAFGVLDDRRRDAVGGPERALIQWRLSTRASSGRRRIGWPLNVMSTSSFPRASRMSPLSGRTTAASALSSSRATSGGRRSRQTMNRHAAAAVAAAASAAPRRRGEGTSGAGAGGAEGADSSTFAAGSGVEGGRGVNGGKISPSSIGACGGPASRRTVRAPVRLAAAPGEREVRASRSRRAAARRPRCRDAQRDLREPFPAARQHLLEIVLRHPSVNAAAEASTEAPRSRAGAPGTGGRGR